MDGWWEVRGGESSSLVWDDLSKPPVAILGPSSQSASDILSAAVLLKGTVRYVLQKYPKFIYAGSF
ncbi:hypothetical protein COCNU_05G004900 [Cocos nucifera]|uniref:Uncharacterized protein n=1 Tax=Cocos nucifera TaxID=13894 RepID=A0A8K0I993_COCNU|nr:hypothetical protein COCNU_05G004900 [Cocos nucifera]